MESSQLAVQFQNIKSNSIEEFRKLDTEPIIYPSEYKNGEVIYPYEKVLTAK